MRKFKHDIEKHGITCYFSDSIAKECDYKVTRTIQFIDYVLKRVLVVYLEGVVIPRDLSKTKASNEDLLRLQDAFLTVKRNIRDFDVLTDPFQAIEEWVIEKLEEEVEKKEPPLLSEFVTTITGIIIQAITELKSNLESIIDLEASFASKSYDIPNQVIVRLLTQNGISYDDATHISVINSHQNRNRQRAVFLTFDYKTIILKWEDIQMANAPILPLTCCDPIYGIASLRK
jgi:hypothetical protein